MLLRIFCFVMSGIGSIMILFLENHWIINLSPSMEIGIWRIEYNKSIKRNDAVVLCFPANFSKNDLLRESSHLALGWCENGYAPILKKVVGLPRDTVVVTEEEVSVNKQIIPGSVTRLYNAHGKTVTHTEFGVHVLGKEEYWLLSNKHPHSFDSRYFGAIKKEWLVGVAIPVFVL